jgi:hypothetical protein
MGGLITMMTHEEKRLLSSFCVPPESLRPFLPAECTCKRRLPLAISTGLNAIWVPYRYKSIGYDYNALLYTDLVFLCPAPR